MSYEESFTKAWQDGGPSGALAFLRAIFHDPANQHVKGKPTDYLHDDEEEREKPPAQGFDDLVRWFSPQGPLEERVTFIVECLTERRDDGSDEAHRFQPFNGFRLQIGTYDWGSAVIDSVSIDATHGTWKRQYGLNHEIVHDSDNCVAADDEAEPDYHFIYTLENGSAYQLKYRGELVDGKRLFIHLRAAQYGAFVAKLVDRVFEAEAFAGFPKALPFRCFISEREFGQEGTVGDLEFHAPITETSLAGHPLRDRLLASAKPPPAPTLEERWLFLMKSLGSPESPEFATLTRLLREHPTLAVMTRKLGEQCLARESTAPEDRELLPRSFARLFWGLSDLEYARAYVKRIVELPLPHPPRGDIEAAIDVVRPTLANLFGTWRDVPDRERADLKDTFETVWARATASEHPVLRLWATEHVLRAEHGDDAISSAYDEIRFAIDVPADYLTTLGACIDEMPKTFEWYGAKWDFVMNRIRGLGERGRPLAERVVRLMNDYCTELRDGGQALENFARILHAIGLEEPPPLVRNYAETKQYHGIDFYAEWAARVIEQRWEVFAQTFARDPAAFAKGAAWEAALYDSKKGAELFEKNMRAADHGDAMFAAFAGAFDATPSPKLASFATSLVTSAHKKLHRGKDRPAAERVVRLLAALPSRSEEQAKMLRTTRLLLVRWAIDDKLPGADELLAEVSSAHPDAPMVAFFRAERLFDQHGPLAAGHVALAAVRAFSKDDLVYRKAFTSYAGVVDLASAEAMHGYCAFRWATDWLHDEHFEEGRWSGPSWVLDGDPFYEGLAQWASKWPEEALEAARQDVRDEAEFLERWRTKSPAELAPEMSASKWSLTIQIMKRLVAEEPTTHALRLLEAYDWFRADEKRRLTVVRTLWPVEALREPLLRHAPFQQDIPWFVGAYPGISAVDLARQCIGTLVELGLADVALNAVEVMEGPVVIGCFLTVSRAIQQLGDFRRGRAVLEKVLEKTNPKQPDYVLLVSNIAVMHVQSGELAAAEAVLDRLFAMDWSRFSYSPRDEDQEFKAILGGDLDEQIAGVFRQYYAMAKYNAACLYGLTKRPAESVAALREASRLHPPQVNAAKLAAEHDFDAVRDDAAFASLVADLERTPDDDDDVDVDDDVENEDEDES